MRTIKTRIKGSRTIITIISILSVLTVIIALLITLVVKEHPTLAVHNPKLKTPTSIADRTVNSIPSTPTSSIPTSATPTPTHTSATPTPSAHTPATPTPTPIPSNPTSSAPTSAGTPNPYPPYTGTQVMDDPLIDNSKGYQWDETTGITSCGFSGGAYHIQATAQGGEICYPEAPGLSSLSNLTYEVSLKTIQGEFAGIAFRFDQSNLTGYGFLIDTQLGTYVLVAANGTSTPFSIILNGLSPAINTGLNQTNVLAAVADGSTISLYINGQFITQANDSTYNRGQLGVFTIDSQPPADVEASNARAWTL